MDLYMYNLVGFFGLMTLNGILFQHLKALNTRTMCDGSYSFGVFNLRRGCSLRSSARRVRGTVYLIRKSFI